MSSRGVGNHGENGDETIARFIVEKTLGVRVCSYDDRRGKSLPDAVIHRAGGVPLEIVSDPNKAENPTRWRSSVGASSTSVCSAATGSR